MNLKTILNLIATYKVTADELLFVYLTFMAQDEEGHPEYLANWHSNLPEGRFKEIFESLKSKGIIKKDYNPESYSPNEVEFNQRFLKSWLKNSGEMGYEFFQEYPRTVLINGKSFFLRKIDKFNTQDEFFFHYSSMIGHNPEKHKEVMDLIKWGKEHGKISCNICSFVNSEMWEDLKQMRDSGNIAEGETVSTFDMYEDE